MDFYWLYDLPSWQLYVVICGSTVFISLIGSLLVRGRIERRLGLDESQNDVIGQFLGFTGIFYGIMLGLVAVGAWDSFKETGDKVASEAATIEAFYRDVSYLPSPTSTRLQRHTADYTRFVIDQAWGLQRQGIVPGGGDIFMNKISGELYGFVPQTSQEQIVFAEALAQFNKVLTAANLRLQAVSDSLPSSLWAVILLGTILNIVLTWLLVIKNKWLDITVNLVVSLLLGSFLFFIVAMDNPFRGELSVSADPYEQIYQNLMR